MDINTIIEEGEGKLIELCKIYANASYLVSEESHDELEEITSLDNIKKEYKSQQHKLLQSIVEMIEDTMVKYQKSSKENLDRNNVMIAYDMDSRYVAMKHFKAKLTINIKE